MVRSVLVTMAWFAHERGCGACGNAVLYVFFAYVYVPYNAHRVFVLLLGEEPGKGYVSHWLCGFPIFFAVLVIVYVYMSLGHIHGHSSSPPPSPSNPFDLRLLLNRYWAAKKEEGKPKVDFRRC